MIELGALKLGWLGHAAFRLSWQGRIIYIDPFQLSKEVPKADIVLISHPHFDHCSMADIKAIIKPASALFAPPDCLSKLARLEHGRLTPMLPGQSVKLEPGMTLETVRAYNIKKAFHPRANDWLGFVLELGATRIYHAGDTDLIPELSALKGIDVALLPVGGNYTMDAAQAAQAAERIKPELAIPMHWGCIVGSLEDARRFAQLAKVQTAVPERDE